MFRRGVLFIMLAGLLVASTLSAQPLPCSDAYAESAEELISSIGSAGLPAGTAAITALVVRVSVFTVNAGNLPTTLILLQLLDNWIDRLVVSGRLESIVGDALIASVEQARAVLASCTATPPLVAFNCRSGDGENELLWLTPPGSHVETLVLARTDRYPQGPSDPVASVVGVFPGIPGATTMATHEPLANGTRSYYAAYSIDASGEPSPGRLTFGRPQTRAGAFRWSYTAGGAAPPSIGGLSGAFMTSSSSGFVFALDPTEDGGLWPAGNVPARIPSPAVARPITLPGSATPTGEAWVLISSRQGRVWAINASTGATEWTSPRIGQTVQASVCGMLTAFGGVDDIVMVGTADGFRANRFVGLDLVDGSIVWSFDNGGGTDRIGPIRSTCAVDYDRLQVYFASEPARFGSQDTVWALSLGDGVATKAWSENHPNVNTSLVFSGDAIYAGTSLGEVLAIDVTDGSSRWSSPYSTGDGPVSGFVFPGSGGRLAFSTANRVHLIEDTGGSAAQLWLPPVSLPDPNVPLLLGNEVIVADAEGRAFDLDASVTQPPVAPFATFGDPALYAPPGLAFFNVVTRLYGVGTSEGVLYVVQAP